MDHRRNPFHDCPDKSVASFVWDQEFFRDFQNGTTSPQYEEQVEDKEPLAERCARVVEKRSSFVIEAFIARVAEVLLIGSVVPISFDSFRAAVRTGYATIFPPSCNPEDQSASAFGWNIA